jgi:hypothetical protein
VAKAGCGILIGMRSAASLPRPPGLHWTIVLLLTIATAGIFLDVWFIVQAIWAKRFDRDSRALVLYIIGIVLSVLAEILITRNSPTGVTAPVVIAVLVLMVVASFRVRDTLGEYITAVEGRPTYLSGVMTLVFGPIYLQYHMGKVRSFLRHHAAAGVS